MEVNKIETIKAKVLKPKKIDNVSNYLQNLCENDEINAIGCVKICPPEPIKFKRLSAKTVFPKCDEQSVSCLKKSDKIPSLIEMKYKRRLSVKLEDIKNIAKAVEVKNVNEIGIENAMWSSICSNATKKPAINPVYTTEWQDSRIQQNDVWNINKFTENHSIINVNPVCDRIPRVQSSYVIVGMQNTWFCAHKEDHDMASMNILLEGAPKIWYILPQTEAAKFENLFNELLGKLKRRLCPTVLRHKCFIIPPWILAKNGIKFTKHIQRPGEVMLTMYGAYHFGFIAGLNVCEAANIISPRFLQFFSTAKLCGQDCL